MFISFLDSNWRIPTIDEMTTDEYGLRSMSDIDPGDLRMSSRLWELQGPVPSVMFANLPAEVITQGVSMIHAEFSKFFRAEYFLANRINKGSLALLRGIQKCFINIQNRCVRATDEIKIGD